MKKEKFTRRSVVAIAIALTGCASDIDDGQLQIIPSLPAPFLSEDSINSRPPEQVETIESTAQFYEDNTIYREIALGVASRGMLSTEYNTASAGFLHQEFRQSLLPQITPVASVDEQGDAIARLQIEQVIFDGGRFRAGRRILSAEQSIAFAQFAIQFNERVGTAVDAYLRQDRDRSLAAVSEEILNRFSEMQSRAQQRLTGGVGNKAELSLFELKQFEAETEVARDKADAQAASFELRQLTGQSFDAPPPDLTFPQDQSAVPPVVALAIAERKRSLGELYAEKAERLPRLSARGSVGIGPSLGLGFDDQANSFIAGISLSRPLTWGKDYGLKAAQTDVRAANARLDEAKRDADVELKTLTLRAIELQRQLNKTQLLLSQAKNRVDEFDQQFLSGSVGMIEAVGIIETYKRILRSKIETRYQLLSVQRQKVEMLGLLGPYSSVNG